MISCYYTTLKYFYHGARSCGNKEAIVDIATLSYQRRLSLGVERGSRTYRTAVGSQTKAWENKKRGDSCGKPEAYLERSRRIIFIVAWRYCSLIWK